MQLWKYSAYVPSQMILKDFHYHQKANYTRPLPPTVIITFCSSQLSNSFFVWTVYNFCFMSAVLLMFNALVKISFLTRLKNVNLNSDPVPEFWRVLYKLIVGLDLLPITTLHCFFLTIHMRYSGINIFTVQYY